ERPDVLGEVRVAQVQELRVEAAERTVGDHPVVGAALDEARPAAPEQAQLPVRVPAAVIDPAAEVVGVAAHLEARERRIGLDRRARRVAQARGAALVGVEVQHPVAGGLRQREVLLVGDPRPVPLQHARRVLARQLERSVAAARVDHDDLVAPGDALETLGDVAFLVLADHQGGQRGPRHARSRSTESTPRTLPISFITAFSERRSATHRSNSWTAVWSSLVWIWAAPMLTPALEIDLVMRASTPGWSTETTRTRIWRGIVDLGSQATAMQRSRSSAKVWG